jgi:hypothetical protein
VATIAGDQAQSLYDAMYYDTLPTWADNNPTWVNSI